MKKCKISLERGKLREGERQTEIGVERESGEDNKEKR